MNCLGFPLNCISALATGHNANSRSSGTNRPPIDRFPLFLKFPLEIQDEIWRSALERHERIIKVHLTQKREIDNYHVKDLAPSRNSDSRKQPEYDIAVEGHRTISKLFSVCCRSRAIALLFYRVQIPCLLFKGPSFSTRYTPATLYFNPEMDFLQISTESFPSRESGLIFVKFVHHLKHVHDRKRLGLRNLAIDMETVAGPNLDGGIYAINPKSIPRHELSDYIETMAQLREVFFVHYVTVNCFDWQRPYLWNSVIDHALPVAPMALHFTRLPHDPRRILQALKDIPVMSHPMLSPFVWSNYSMYGIADNYEWRPRYSVLIASQPRRRIYNARQGREWLEDHSLRWGECLPLFNRYWRNRTETLDPVFGFWLFDLHAFDNILDGEFWPGLDTRPGWMGPARRWPALGVVDLY